MNYLLDTHAFIWWLEDSTELSATARKVISNPENRIFMSHASLWELAIKISIGRLVFPLASIETELQQNGFEMLAIKTSHIICSATLPEHHRDPFDRMLVAQSQIENITLITFDKQVQAYDLMWEW